MQNAALLKSLVENAIDGILTIDEYGIIESINPSACKLFEYTQEEILGKNISVLMPKPEWQKHDQYLHNYKTTGKAKIIGIGRELFGLKKGGLTFPMRLTVSEVDYSEKKIYAGFIHDLSLQKEAEEKLKQYAAHLEELVENRTQSLNDSLIDLQVSKEKVSRSLQKEKELSKLKNRFLSMASHEFRTPLSTVQLSASLIDKYAEPLLVPNIGKHVAKIKNAVSNLTAILNDFLYMETLENRKMKVDFTNFNLETLGIEIVEEMQMLTKENQNIIYQHYGDIPTVCLDKNLIKNSIINLISNAIKYSGDFTSITFHTEIHEKECVISVRDNGIGIPEKDQKHLFEAFYRAHNTGNIPGTGLGLNIVQRYVSLLNGTISFNSNEQSTIFTLNFPLL